MLYTFCLHLLAPAGRFLYRLRYEGLEHIPKSGKLILCSNHISVCDPFFLAVPFPRQIRYMAKSELFEDHGRLARWLLYRWGAFPVRRGKGDAESIRTAETVLNRGGVVGIFPQGKCVAPGVRFVPKAGAALVAARTHAPVLPAGISCGGKVKPFRRVTVRFGRVIPCEELGAGSGSLALVRSAAEILAERINELLEEPK